MFDKFNLSFLELIVKYDNLFFIKWSRISGIAVIRVSGKETSKLLKLLTNWKNSQTKSSNIKKNQ